MACSRVTFTLPIRIFRTTICRRWEYGSGDRTWGWLEDQRESVLSRGRWRESFFSEIWLSLIRLSGCNSNHSPVPTVQHEWLYTSNPYTLLILYSLIVTICTAQWSLYVPHSGRYMYRTVVATCTAQWSLYVQHSGHYMYQQFNNQQFHVLPTQCIYVFCVDLRTNSHYFPIQH